MIEAATRWEYTTLRVDSASLMESASTEGKSVREPLNQLGSEGWELVSVLDTGRVDGESVGWVFLFKRPRAKPAASDSQFFLKTLLPDDQR